MDVCRSLRKAFSELLLAVIRLINAFSFPLSSAVRCIVQFPVFEFTTTTLNCLNVMMVVGTQLNAWPGA